MSQTYLLELTAEALDLHDTRLELNRDVGRDFKIQILVDGKHRGLLYCRISIGALASCARRQYTPGTSAEMGRRRSPAAAWN